MGESCYRRLSAQLLPSLPSLCQALHISPASGGMYLAECMGLVGR